MTVPGSRAAIVTGASRGIGAAVAKRLARDGLCIVVNYAGSESAARDVVAAIEGDGGRAVAVRADVADPAAARTLFDAATEAFGGVDVLGNNAGVMQLETLADSDDAMYERMMNINLRGSFNTMREAARRWQHRERLELGRRLEVRALRHLCRHQGGDRDDDADPRQGAARS